MEDAEIPNLSPEEIRTIKTQYNKAKDVLENINALNIRYDAAFQAFTTRNQDTEKVANDVRDIFNSIENLKTESASFLSEIKANLDKATFSIELLNEALPKFENIKGRIESKDGEIEGLVATATSLKTDIETAKASAQQKLADIDSLFTQVQERITQMQEAHETFIAIHAKITDPTTGLEAVLNQSADLQKQSASTIATINSYNEESKKILELIKIDKTETEKIRIETQKVLEEINLDKEEVRTITALITDTGFEHAFQKREKMLRTSSFVWLIVFILSIGGLIFALYEFFRDFKDVPELNVLIYRLSLTSPILFLIGVSIKQYSNERALNEKYAFKATIAAVLRNHAKFLIEIKDEAGEENATFIRETLGNVYFEPYEKGLNPKDIKKDLDSALGNKSSKKTKHLEEVIQRTKELKDLIPDNETLKGVVDLLLRIK